MRRPRKDRSTWCRHFAWWPIVAEDEDENEYTIWLEWCWLRITREVGMWRAYQARTYNPEEDSDE